MTTRLISTLGLCIAPWAAALAQQDIGSLREGQRIRVTVPAMSPSRFSGTLLQRASDSLVLQTRTASVAIPLAAVARVERSRGRKSAVGKGLLIGLLGGLVLGTVVATITCANYDPNGVGSCHNSQEGAVVTHFLAPLGLGVVA